MSANRAVFKRWFRRFLVGMSALAIGTLVGVLVISPTAAETRSTASHTDRDASLQRGIEASAARYSALATIYATENDGLLRGVEASAARYSALAGYYGAEQDDLRRGTDADAARYSALAAYYAGQGNDSLQRSLDADAARYSALAEYYGAVPTK